MINPGESCIYLRCYFVVWLVFCFYCFFQLFSRIGHHSTFFGMLTDKHVVYMGGPNKWLI